MKFLKQFDKWLKERCNRLSASKQRKMLIIIFVAYVIISLMVIGQFIYQF